MSYSKALAQLSRFIAQGELNELEEQGIIQAFEFTHELAWNVMKDYLAYQGTARESFKAGLITDGEGWMEMVRSRNLSFHTYDENVASAIRKQIVDRYYALFVAFERKMLSLKS